jgi:lysosomal alpha-mannosidase
MHISSLIIAWIFFNACHGANLLFEPEIDDVAPLKPNSHAPSSPEQSRKSLTSHGDHAKEVVKKFLDQLDSREQSKQNAKVDSSDAQQQCGYASCDLGKDGYINVHMVPHTHDDVGWLRTVDQYYYHEVQYILDTVISDLLDEPEHRFIYVEIGFFIRWWRQQDDTMRHQVKRLVNAGRLEFILGGWCMNDEASTHYSAIIDQHAFGFRFLRTNFGECARPKIGWQIDPFGHSREQASLFAQFGFDALFFARLDYQDRDARLKAKSMEMMWRASQSLGDQSSLFTSVLFDMYGPPGGFCFDCDDAPIQDDQRLEDYNVDDRVKEFFARIDDRAKVYTTNHIMMTMGSDFQYQNAVVNFKNIDKLIRYVNAAAEASGRKINLFYSTPSCYVNAVNKANLTYTHKEDDFFPYASSESAFWTGYFTSRAALKGYERATNNFFQVCRQLDALTLLGAEHGSDKKIQILRDAMGVVQHHDGVRSVCAGI